MTSESKKLTDAQWRDRLSPEQYRILRDKGTEPAFTGKYVDEKTRGVYRCAGCGTPVFNSETKYNSGSGWPSFTEPAQADNVAQERDTTLGMTRTEVLCAQCDGHLGHVFPDGPGPDGLRYCINSASLDFEETPDDDGDG